MLRYLILIMPVMFTHFWLILNLLAHHIILYIYMEWNVIHAKCVNSIGLCSAIVKVITIFFCGLIASISNPVIKKHPSINSPRYSYPAGTVALWLRCSWCCHNVVARSIMRVVATSVSDVATTSYDVATTLLQRRYIIKQWMSTRFLITDN